MILHFRRSLSCLMVVDRSNSPGSSVHVEVLAIAACVCVAVAHIVFLSANEPLVMRGNHECANI
jgi:hypothetical protein